MKKPLRWLLIVFLLLVVAGGAVYWIAHNRARETYAANEVTLLAAEHFGAMGVMRDMPLQKYVNDSFIFLNAGDHDSSTKLLVADAVTDYRTDAQN